MSATSDNFFNAFALFLGASLLPDGLGEADCRNCLMPSVSYYRYGSPVIIDAAILSCWWLRLER